MTQNLSVIFLKARVVSKMGILAKTSNYQKCIKKTNKIPDYARGYRNEYLFIRGINKTCGKFVKLIKENEEFYNSYEALRITSKIKEIKRLGYSNNIRRIKFEIDDIENIEFIKSEIEEYRDLYLDEETYNIEVEYDNPGFKSFYKHFTRFYEELNYRNEYLFIGGFNKTCKKFVKLLKENEEFYNSSKALRIIRKIKEIKRNNIRIDFEIDDIENLEFIKSKIEKYRDLYCNPFTGDFNEEVYNLEADIDNPGFKSFYKHFCRFYDELLIDNYYYY